MNIKLLLKKRWIKWTLEILFFVLLYLILRGYMQRDIISGQAPAIKATTIKQQAFDLHPDAGKPILVHFWATWCGVCRLEQDSIESLSKDYNVITIAMRSGSDDELKEYLKDNELSFRVINDEFGDIVKAYGIGGVPASFVVNGKNEIEFSEVGFTSSWGLRFRLWLSELNILG